MSFRLEGRAFNKLFASTPGVFSSSFRATDVDLVFARVSRRCSCIDEITTTPVLAIVRKRGNVHHVRFLSRSRSRAPSPLQLESSQHDCISTWLRTNNDVQPVSPSTGHASKHSNNTFWLFARPTQVKDKNEKTLTYEQFASALNVMAATLFPEVRGIQNIESIQINTPSGPRRPR